MESGLREDAKIKCLRASKTSAQHIDKKKEQEKIKENDTQVYREDVVISSMP